MVLVFSIVSLYKGDTKHCATSSQAMHDFVQEIMRRKTPNQGSVHNSCFTLNSPARKSILKVSLGGERVRAVAVCHLDISERIPSRVTFWVLGILPGTSPICHFIPLDNLVRIPKITTAQALWRKSLSMLAVAFTSLVPYLLIYLCIFSCFF